MAMSARMLTTRAAVVNRKDAKIQYIGNGDAYTRVRSVTNHDQQVEQHALHINSKVKLGPTLLINQLNHRNLCKFLPPYQAIHVSARANVSTLASTMAWYNACLHSLSAIHAHYSLELATECPMLDARVGSTAFAKHPANPQTTQ